MESHKSHVPVTTNPADSLDPSPHGDFPMKRGDLPLPKMAIPMLPSANDQGNYGKIHHF